MADLEGTLDVNGVSAPYFIQEETEAQFHTVINGQHWEIT